MFQPLLESIQPFGPFSQDELSMFESKLVMISFKKNELILKEGEICQAFYFLLKGSCSHYFSSENDTDNILNLYVKGNWVTDHQSLIRQKPSTTCIRAFEDCETASINLFSFHQLIQASPIFFKIGKLMDSMQFTDYTTNFKSPEEKYLDLLNTRPDVIQKFPLKDIASYLRIAPETLSRIRKRIQ